MRANEQWWTNPLRSIVLDPSRCACCEVTIAVCVLVQECEIWVTSNEQTPNLDCFPSTLRLAGHFGPSCFEFVLFWNPKLCGMGAHGFYICLLVRSAGHIFSNRPALWPVCCLANTFQRYKNTIERTSRSPFHVLCPSLPHCFSSLPFLSRHFILLKHMDCHCYLPNIVWQRRSGNFYWLKIKVAKSPPQIPPFLLEPLKNRGKHQFLTHQWRLHNQLKKTLVWGCKSYLCLIKAFRRYMPGFNVIK